ncbi:MAG: hypothetical protein GXP45_02425 [bacterium]|nr:hypothetical protein [bacterium]
MDTIVKQPSVTYKFYNLSKGEEEKIKTIVQKNIEVKSDSYLKSIFSNNKNAIVKIDYKIQKNKQNRFDASFRFFYNGKSFVYKNKSSFKFTDDLVNHAFTHFTRAIANRNKVENDKRADLKNKKTVAKAV